MPDKFNNKYRIPSNRLQGYDYGSSGAYFITICTKNRIPYFGEISIEGEEKKILFSEIGSIAFEYWEDIPKHFLFVWLDEFQIMPDHIHGIIFIDKQETQEFAVPYQNKFGPQSKNLSSIVRGYKAGVKSCAVKSKLAFEWQERFHDHIIRDQDDFDSIRKYIRSNIENWEIK